MQFQKGQSGNPLGRPPGARNKATIMAEGLLESEAEAITRIVIEKAKDGDMTALRMCLDRFAPPRKERAIAFDLPPLATTADALKGIAALAAATAEGELTPSEAGEMLKLVDGFAHALEVATLEQRVARLEEQQMTSENPARRLPCDAR
jgi:hypothetical protein